MYSTYKKFSTQDIGQVPFNAHKQYHLNTSTDLNGFTSNSIEGTLSSDNYVWTSASIDTLSSGAKNGVYPTLDTQNSLKYFQLDHLFYKNYKLSLNEKLGNVHYLKHKRELYNEVRTISIPNGLCGSAIKPLSFNLLYSSGSIIDDSYGNLYVSGSNLLQYNTDIRSNILRIGPEKGFKKYDLNVINDEFEAGVYYRRGKTKINQISSFSSKDVLDDSYFFNLLNYKDVTFSSTTLHNGEFSEINFNGTTSELKVENDEKFHFNPGDDFTISFWADIKGPTVGQLVINTNNITASSDTTENLTLISSDGTTRTYRCTAGPNSANLGGGVVGIAWEMSQATSNKDNVKATLLAAAINGSTGHNGKLVASVVGDVVTIKQLNIPATVGTVGNTTVTATANFNALVDGSVSSIFSGGTDIDSYLISKSTTKTVVPFPASSRNGFKNLFDTGSAQLVDKPAGNQYPFEIYVVNKEVFFRRSDGNNIKVVSSSFNPNSHQHISCRVSSSKLNIFINGLKTGSSATENFLSDTQNNANLYIGNKGGISKFLSGALSQINIYDDPLTDTQILNHYSSSNGSPYVGNIFYESGLATITHPIYNKSLNVTGLKFQGSHLIYENEYQCTINEHEYNYTLNPSARRNKNLNSQDIANFATGSTFKPYVTTVGLYNEAGELLVVGKLGQPVRMSDETDTTFVIRWDK